MAEHPNRKFKAAKPITQKEGPTFTDNDPAKFPNKGTKRGKTMVNGVIAEAKGPTFTANETHIPTMNADKPPSETKVKSDKPWFDPHTHHESADALTASQNGSGSPTDRPYPLKKEYRK